MARIAVRLENDPQLAPQDSQEMASLAESRGYEMVWVPEGSGRDSLDPANLSGGPHRPD